MCTLDFVRGPINLKIESSIIILIRTMGQYSPIQIHRYWNSCCSQLIKKIKKSFILQILSPPLNHLDKMRIFVFILYILLQSVNSELYTTYVNFEKYYFIEEELISLVDLIVQQEKIIHGEDVHNILNISQ